MMKKLYRKQLSLTALALLLFSTMILAQERTVSGKVSDEGGQPLPGVSVLVKGTSVGTVTDTDGKYSIAAPDNSTLVFSFIGYTAQEIAVGTQTTVDIAMQPSITSLEEVVVVGYGEQKKALVTGAISSVKAEELASVSVSTIDQALQGRTSGVNIIPNSGSPGAATKIRIRGIGSNGNSNPLFIIDGVRSSTEGMDFLSPNDIASIEVLKDAASTAIYGTAGANGVIIVTTKKGKAGTSELSYSGQLGMTSVRKDGLKVMNRQQYQTFMQETNPTAPGVDPVTGTPYTWTNHPEIANNQTDTDWLDVVFDDAPFQNHSLNFSGGTDKSSLFISGNYWDQEGIAGGDKSSFKRYTARINSSHRLKEWLNIGENFTYTHTNRMGITEDSEYGSVVGSGLSLDPLTPVVYTGTLPSHMQTYITQGRPLVRNEDGLYYGLSRWVTGEFGNPLIAYDINKGKTTQNKLFGNIYAEVKPIKNLTFTSRLGMEGAFQRRHQWNPTYWYSIERQNTTATGQDNWEEWFNTQWENFATYDNTFSEDHHITFTLGTAAQKNIYNQITTFYSNLFKQEDEWSYANDAPRDGDIAGGRANGNNLLSYFGRLSYDFKDKYLFTATFRRDGSSLFADGHQWGNFPSVSLGWVASEEDFFSAIGDYVSFLKIRGSWGVNGSNFNVNPGEWKNSIVTSQNGPIRYATDAGAYLVGAAPNFGQNPNLTWETSEQISIGTDMRFMNDNLIFSFDWFKKTTEDLITTGSSPGPAGINIARVNAGSVENTGIELELGYGNRSAGSALQYDVSVNFTSLKNEVTELNKNIANEPAGANVGTHWGNATRFKVGEPIWYFQGYKTDGIFQSAADVASYLSSTGITGYAPVAGDPRILDTNDDNLISPADWVNIGNPHPSYYFGARVSLKYKGLDFLVFAQGQGGNDVMMGFFRTDRGTANKPDFFFTDRWTPENQTNEWFRASTGGLAYQSDFMVQKGNFTRIRQLQLGYSLPSSISQTIGMKGLRVYVSLDNYFTFTKYKGMDPEAGSGNNNSIGIDRGVYPVPRKVLGGLTLTF